MMVHPLIDKSTRRKQPIAKAVGMPGGNNILLIALGKDISIKPHVAKSESRLLVLTGSIAFNIQQRQYDLYPGDEQDIPAGELHALTATSDCLCLLIQQ